MALNLESKKAIVAEVSEVAQRSLSAVVAEYHGLSVGQMTELRVQAREQGVYLRVVRNTLAKRAVEGTSLACLQEAMTGPLVYAFADEAPGAAARLIRDFAKTNDKLVPKAIAIDGALLGAESLNAVASLPNREEALSKLLATMQAPAAKLVRTLNEVPGKLVRTLAAIRSEKESV